MTHPRVTPQGRAMGRNASRLSEQGLQILKAAGLDDVDAPMLRKTMCKTCACTPDSVPNGCLQTQMDFLKSVSDGKPFLCHSPKNGQMCAGWVRARAAVVATPLPTDVIDLIGKWEYSPADMEEST